MKATFVKQELIPQPSTTSTFIITDEVVESQIVEWFKNTGSMHEDEIIEFIPPMIKVTKPYKP